MYLSLLLSSLFFSSSSLFLSLSYRLISLLWCSNHHPLLSSPRLLYFVSDHHPFYSDLYTPQLFCRLSSPLIAFSLLSFPRHLSLFLTSYLVCWSLRPFSILPSPHPFSSLLFPLQLLSFMPSLLVASCQSSPHPNYLLILS